LLFCAQDRESRHVEIKQQPAPRVEKGGCKEPVPLALMKNLCWVKRVLVKIVCADQLEPKSFLIVQGYHQPGSDSRDRSITNGLTEIEANKNDEQRKEKVKFARVQDMAQEAADIGTLSVVATKMVAIAIDAAIPSASPECGCKKSCFHVSIHCGI